MTKLGLGVKGLAIATDITYISNMVFTDAYLIITKTASKTYVKFDRDALRGWGYYLKIGIPGACMLCFEWWAFELLAIFSGYLGVVQLAAEVVVINMITFIFMMPLGVSYAASCLVGNYIGERRISLAKRFANYTILFDVILTIIILIILGTL